MTSFKKQNYEIALGVFHLCAMMTSQVKGLSFPQDITINDWKNANLPKATLVRLAKVVTLEKTLIKKLLEN